ncbi:MAG: HEAT repeat domain-containing protein, partial [Actinomycetota bacterium]|nr:HEAT repeat domain-containing protein [Actinomycetota bacterium]
AGDPAAIPPLLAALTAERGLPQGVVGMAVLDIGTSALPALRESVRSASPAAQGVAAELLGVHGDLVAAGVLESALGDPGRETGVRRAAATALGRIGSPRPADALSRVLAHSDFPELRSAAAEALGRIGDPAALPALIAGLAAPEADVRAACADALVVLGPEGREWLASLADVRGPAGDAARAALDAVPSALERMRA